MSLTTYNRKRNFKKTPEPKGKKGPRKGKLRYLIQKHAASHLHYDFRLELAGVLKSWAVPKGPCYDPSVKRLAVHVEDHPISYGDFQGTIPKGEYGGGTVMLWDKGTWECLDADPIIAYKKGNLSFIIQGKKLQGRWKLIRIHSDPKNWLLMKVHDELAQSIQKFDVTEAMPLSVKDKKTLQAIAGKQDQIWHSNRTKKKAQSAPKKTFTSVHHLVGIKKALFPKGISTQLATLVRSMPEPEGDWLYEVKYDGYRLISFINKNQIKLITRGKQDWTHKFATIANSLAQLKLNNAVVDGEIVAVDADNKSNFQLLQNALTENISVNLIYYIFDILYFDQFDLTAVELIQRKSFLKALLKYAAPNIGYSDHFVGDGQALLRKACQLKLEGLIAKEIHSKYIQKRSKSWLKIKCQQRQELIICGFTRPQGSRQYFGSLLLGVYDHNKQLQYCGNVGTGFNQQSLKTVAKALEQHITKTMPFNKRPPGSSSATWVKPILIAEVEFTEWTQDGSLRHPSFKGLRFDKKAAQIKKEEPEPMPKQATKSAKNKNRKANFPLSHPDKILYPEQGITKADLVEYYALVSKWMLPYVSKRPLTLVRCPNGRGKCFYQKHLAETDSDIISSILIEESEGPQPYPYIENSAGLFALVQLGVLEIHTWGCDIKAIEKPNCLVFDIDPAPTIPWSEIVATAKLIRNELLKYKLQSFVKTTGGKGLHVVVPILPKHDWETIKTFTHTFVNYLEAKYPERYVTTISKKKRVGKIFIDYLRNQRGATFIAPYSTRARENAPVSVPLTWEELTAKLDPLKFTVKTIQQRLTKLKNDPWAQMSKLKQKLPI